MSFFFSSPSSFLSVTKNFEETKSFKQSQVMCGNDYKQYMQRPCSLCVCLRPLLLEHHHMPATVMNASKYLFICVCVFVLFCFFKILFQYDVGKRKWKCWLPSFLCRAVCQLNTSGLWQACLYLITYWRCSAGTHKLGKHAEGAVSLPPMKNIHLNLFYVELNSCSFC